MSVKLFEDANNYYGVYFENADNQSSIVYSANFDAMAKLARELKTVDLRFIDGWDDIRYIRRQVQKLCRDMFGSKVDIHYIDDCSDCTGFGEYQSYDSAFGAEVTVDVIGYIYLECS